MDRDIVFITVAGVVILALFWTPNTTENKVKRQHECMIAAIEKGLNAADIKLLCN